MKPVSKERRVGGGPAVSEGGKVLPALCHVVGTIILVSAVVLLIPAVAPKAAGCEVYEVVSASMAPEIPVGSMILVKTEDPAAVQEGDIIAYQSGEDVITHRVKQNRRVEGEFITQGDANETEDMAPVPYDSLIGRVTLHIPAVGAFLRLLTGTVGKVYLAIYVVCGLLFHVLASRLRGKEREETGGEGDADRNG